MKENIYNQYPEGYLYDTFNKPVTFELVGVKMDPENPKKKLLPRSKNVPSISRTVFKDAKGVSTPVTLAYIVDGEIARDIEFGLINDGVITLFPDADRAIEKFNYMNYCSFNESSKWRVSNVKPMFRRVDESDIAIKKLEFRKLVKQALAIVDNMDDKDLFTHVGLFKPGVVDPTVARNILEEAAERDPKAFIKMIDTTGSSDLDDVVRLCKKAKDLKVISNNSRDRIFAYTGSGETIMNYSAPNAGYKELAAFFVANPLEMDKLKTLVKGAE